MAKEECVNPQKTGLNSGATNMRGTASQHWQRWLLNRALSVQILTSLSPHARRRI